MNEEEIFNDGREYERNLRGIRDSTFHIRDNIGRIKNRRPKDERLSIQTNSEFITDYVSRLRTSSASINLLYLTAKEIGEKYSSEGVEDVEEAVKEFRDARHQAIQELKKLKQRCSAESAGARR